MKDTSFAFVTGAVAGMLLLGVLISTIDGPFSQGKAALDTCEAALPRNQVCVITAVPKKEEQP